jgi:hypothetical protein
LNQNFSSMFTIENQIDENDPKDERINLENLTYYFSNFNIFGDSFNFYFTKYEIFKKNLNGYLGEDWNKYAKEILYRVDENNKKTYLNNDEVFHFALEIWLELRKEINLTDIDPSKNSEISKQDEGISIESKFEENQVFEIFEKKFREKFTDCLLNDSFYKAVLQGFYATANKVWKETIETNFKSLSNAEDDQEKINQEEDQAGGKLDYLKNKWRRFRENESKSYIIKPMLIASEKIFDYFNYSKKKIETNNGKSMELEKDYNETKNLTNFHSNVQREASEELKNKLSNLSLEENPRDSEDLKNPNRKRKCNEVSSSKSVFNVKKFSKNEEKNFLNPVFIDSTAQYIENFMKTSQEKWQVARGFVTNMIEVNYNRISFLENKISSKANDLKNHIKIRFLQPAQSFYHHLMKVWIIFKTNNYQSNISFSEYLEMVKKSMGDSWSEK